jgi:tetratricopeptide (TPR) repeat protein
MGTMLEGLRREALDAAAAQNCARSFWRWEGLRALTAAAYGRGDPRSRTALSRAAYFLLGSAPVGDPLPGTRLPEREYCLAAAARCASWALAGGDGGTGDPGRRVPLPEEGLTEEYVADAARNVSLSLLRRVSGPVLPAPVPARSAVEALWPGPSAPPDGGSGPGVCAPDPWRDIWEPPADVSRDSVRALGDELAAASSERGKLSREALNARSRLGEAMAVLGGGGPAESRKALGHLRAAAKGLARLLGGEHYGDEDFRDASARLAVRLMRGPGPYGAPGVRRAREAAPQVDVAEALEVWSEIVVATVRSPALRELRTDAAVRAAEACSALGLQDRAAEFANAAIKSLADRKNVTETTTRDMRAVRVLGDSFVDRGDLPKAREFHARAMGGFRRLLGQTHPETVRSMCRLAEVCDLEGGRVRAAALRCHAAEALELLAEWAGKDPRDDPDARVLLRMVGNAFLEAGDAEEARAVTAPAAEALQRLLGEDDPDTVLARELLARCDRAGHPDGR